jgi:phosphocarrier protein
VSNSSSAIVTIANKLGLHARPATLFVEAAQQYEADIAVRRIDHREAVNGKSILEMMMLAATQGTELEVTATGTDADTAIKTLVDLVRSKFEED